MPLLKNKNILSSYYYSQLPAVPMDIYIRKTIKTTEEKYKLEQKIIFVHVEILAITIVTAMIVVIILLVERLDMIMLAKSAFCLVLSILILLLLLLLEIMFFAPKVGFEISSMTDFLESILRIHSKDKL